MTSSVSNSVIKDILYTSSMNLHSLDIARKSFEQNYSNIDSGSSALKEIVKKCNTVSRQLKIISLKVGASPFKNDYALLKGRLNGQREKIKRLVQVDHLASFVNSMQKSNIKEDLQQEKKDKALKQRLEKLSKPAPASHHSKHKPSAKKSAAQPKAVKAEFRALLEKALHALETGHKTTGLTHIHALESKHPKIAQKIFGQIWDLEGEALVRANKKLAHVRFGRVAFFSLEGRSVSSLTRVKAIKAVLNGQ